MKIHSPPVAPHGSAAAMRAYNDLRRYIMERQVADVKGIVIGRSIITTASGKIVQWWSLGGDALTSGGPPIYGACCFGGVCTITTSDSCPGGFCGVGTTCGSVTCDGNTCIDGGGGERACCIEGECTTATSGDCYDSGGVPQDEGSSCGDVGVCDMPDCQCGFDGGDGRKFLNRTTIGSLTFSSSGECGCIEVQIDYQEQGVMDPMADLCIGSTTCSGTAHGHADNPTPQCGFAAVPCECDMTLGGDCLWSSCVGCGECAENIGFWLTGLHAYCGTIYATCDNNCSATHCDNSMHWHGLDPTDFNINTYLSNECNPV